MKYNITLNPLLTEVSDIKNDDTASFHIKTRELINRIPPYANWFVQQIVGCYVHQRLGNEGFGIYDGWYCQSSNYPGVEYSYHEYAEFSDSHHTEEALILNLANISSIDGLPVEESISFNPLKSAA